MNRLRRVSISMQIGVAVLLLTITVGLAADAPVRSLVPYGLAVAMTTGQRYATDIEGSTESRILDCKIIPRQCF